jgi:hypothetical protein
MLARAGFVGSVGRIGSRRKEFQVIKGGQLNGVFERDAIANTFDSDGLLQSVAVDTPRTVWIDGVPLFWTDGQVTEISGRSDAFDEWLDIATAAVAQDAVGLDGEANSGWTLTDDGNTITALRQINVALGGTDSASYYLIPAIKKNLSPDVYPANTLILTGGSQLNTAVVIDPSDGTATSAVEASVEIGDFFHIAHKTTNNGTNSEARPRAFPAFNTTGTITPSSSAQGSTVCGYAGLFKDNWSLLPVLTTGGVTKSVPAEDASIALGSVNLSQGSIDFEFLVPAVQGTDPYIWELRSDADNRINAYIDTSDSNTIKFDIRKTGESLITVDSGVSVTALTLHKGAVSWQQDLFVISIDGTTAGTATSGEVPPMDTAYIGSLGGTDNYLFGGLGALTYKPTPYTAAQAEAASA